MDHTGAMVEVGLFSTTDEHVERRVRRRQDEGRARADGPRGSDGAREERARIVAWLRGRLPALPYYQWDAKAFDIELTADAIERGEHEEKANG